MIERGRPSVRVLVTGFGPFPGVPHNASASLMTALAQSMRMPGIELFAEVIPVKWADAGRAAREAIARVEPHAILHFGVSKRVTGFEIETRAFNISGPKRDHAGVAGPNSPLDRAGKPVLFPAMPPAVLLRALRRSGFPAQLSRSAGRYLCNALFYWSLADAGSSGRLVSFIHIPLLPGDANAEPSFSLKDATAGAHVLVRASAQAVISARRSG
jgi:pyroglutamyl-peptidase